MCGIGEGSHVAFTPSLHIECYHSRYTGENIDYTSTSIHSISYYNDIHGVHTTNTVLALIFAGLMFRELKPGRHIRVFIFANGVRLIYIIVYSMICVLIMRSENGIFLRFQWSSCVRGYHVYRDLDCTTRRNSSLLQIKLYIFRHIRELNHYYCIFEDLWYYVRMSGLSTHIVYMRRIIWFV